MEYRLGEKFKGVRIFSSEVKDGSMDKENIEANLPIFLDKIGQGSVAYSEQVHGSTINLVNKAGFYKNSNGVVTGEDIALFVKSADCIPLLFFSEEKGVIGAIHVGRKSLLKNIISTSLKAIFEKLDLSPTEAKFFIGPHVRAGNYEVKGETIGAIKTSPYSPFLLETNGKSFFDLTGAALQELAQLGVKEENIVDPRVDTFEDERFFSYRRGDRNKLFITLISKWPKKQVAQIYRILLFLISIVFIYLIFRQFGDLTRAAQTLSQGSWYFILPVVGIQVLAIINKGAFYQTLYDFFKVKDSLWQHIKMSLAANFLNLAAPSGGLSGMAIYMAEARRHGVSKSRSTFINFFAYFVYYAVFTLILLFGLFYLVFNHQLYRYQVITASILFGMIFFIVVAFIAVIEEAARLNKLFSVIAQIINFFTRIFNKKDVLEKHDISLLTKEIHSCLTYIQNKWQGLWLPIFHVLLAEAIDVITLYYLFLAFQYPVYPGIIITAYAICVLFTLVSITPGGIGVVEAAMIFVLTNLQVPVELAAVAVLGFRIIGYWVPFGLGFLSFRSLHIEKMEKIENGTD